MNLLDELKKRFPDDKIEIEETFIEDIREAENPDYTLYLKNLKEFMTKHKFKKVEDVFNSDKDFKEYTGSKVYQQDNSIRTYTVILNDEKTTATMFYNHLYTDEEDYDLINNVGKYSVDMMERKINEWVESE